MAVAVVVEAEAEGSQVADNQAVVSKAAPSKRAVLAFSIPKQSSVTKCRGRAALGSSPSQSAPASRLRQQL